MVRPFARESLFRSTNLILVVLVLAAVTRFWRLDTPSGQFFDESGYVPTAQKIIDNDGSAWDLDGPARNAPPLTVDFIAAGAAVFGEDSAFGWRFFSAIAGIGTVLFTYLIARRLFGNEWLALAAGFLIAVENLALVESRIAVPEPYVQLSLTASYYFLIRDKYLVSGALLGAAIAGKWLALPGILPVLLYLGMRYRDDPRLRRAGEAARWLVRPTICFTLVPLAVYLLTYTPMLANGRSVEHIWALNKESLRFHTHQGTSATYSSAWYKWPVIYRPMVYYIGDISEEQRRNDHPNQIKFRQTGSISYFDAPKIYSMGNPAVLWAGIPALLFVLWKGIGYLRAPPVGQSVGAPEYLWDTDRACLFVAGTYLSLWVTWILSPRAMYIYHYLPELPWVAIALAFSLSVVWQRPRWGPPLVIAYLLLATAMFVYFYPHVTAIEVPRWWDQSFYWFPSWR
jgi:dolichyl-phosphate-mannose--protein O-mannosyl transferase